MNKELIELSHSMDALQIELIAISKGFTKVYNKFLSLITVNDSQNKGYITEIEIAQRENPDYYYIIKYDGPGLVVGRNKVEYVGDGGTVYSINDAKQIGNIRCAKIILKNMKDYYSSNPDCVGIYKVSSNLEKVE